MWQEPFSTTAEDERAFPGVRLVTIRDSRPLVLMTAQYKQDRQSLSTRLGTVRIIRTDATDSLQRAAVFTLAILGCVDDAIAAGMLTYLAPAALNMRPISNLITGELEEGRAQSEGLLVDLRDKLAARVSAEGRLLVLTPEVQQAVEAAIVEMDRPPDEPGSLVIAEPKPVAGGGHGC